MEITIEADEAYDLSENHVEQKVTQTQPKQTEVKAEVVEEETQLEEKKEWKPWHIDESGKKISDYIPRDRYNEINEKVKAKEIEANELREKLKAYESKQDKISNIKDLADIKIDDYETVEEWLSDVLKADRKLENERKEQEARIESYRKAEQDLITRFDNNVAKIKSEIPDIEDAIRYLADRKDYFPPETMYALMDDDNAAKIIYEITSNQDLLIEFTKLSPIQAARKIGKMSTKYDKLAEMESEPRVDKTLPQLQARKPVAGTPKLAGSVEHSALKYDDNDESIDSLRRDRLARKKK